MRPLPVQPGQELPGGDQPRHVGVAGGRPGLTGGERGLGQVNTEGGGLDIDPAIGRKPELVGAEGVADQLRAGQARAGQRRADLADQGLQRAFPGGRQAARPDLGGQLVP